MVLITVDIILSSHRFWIILGGLALSALLIAGGVVGLLTARNEAKTDRVLSEIYANTSKDFPQRELTREALRESVDGAWVARAGIISDFEASVAGYHTAEGRVWLNRSVADLRRGLILAPANGFGWMRYAAALVRLNRTGSEAVAALKMSLFTTRHSSGVDRMQVALLAVLWPKLDPETETFARQVLLRTWRQPAKRVELVPFMRNAGTQAILRDAIGAGEAVDTWVAQTQAAAEVERARREDQSRQTMPPGP